MAYEAERVAKGSQDRHLRCSAADLVGETDSYLKFARYRGGTTPRLVAVVQSPNEAAVVNRSVRFLIGFTAIAFIFGLLWFGLSMEVHQKFYRPTTFEGKPVVRYGFSRFHSRYHFNAKTGVGDVIEGRCFVEIMDQGKLRRVSGWKLKREIDRDQKRARFSILR